MSKPIELNIFDSFDVVETDFLTNEVNEIKLVKNFGSAKSKKIAVFGENKVNVASSAKVCQLGVGFIRSNDEFNIVGFELNDEMVGHIRTDIDGLGHLFVALLVSSVQ